MASFVMIHGAWHGGWSFEPLRARLEAAGHALIAPDLPGMVDDEAALAGVTLDGWAGFVVNQCRATPAPVILCGHSRAGIVISRAAELDPEAMAMLVYICAMLIPAGLSRAEFRARQIGNPDFAAIRLPHPSGRATVVDAANAIPVFYQRSPRALAEAALARLVPEPNGPAETRLELTEARFGSVPRHYIECLDDRTIPIEDQRTMHELTPCDSVITLDADHSPFLSAPGALADALLALAMTVE